MSVTSLRKMLPWKWMFITQPDFMSLEDCRYLIENLYDFYDDNDTNDHYDDYYNANDYDANDHDDEYDKRFNFGSKIY